jgi:2-haloacid dehalogenase
MKKYNIKNIVFDLGGVLIDWNPRYLFTEVIENHDELEFFLTKICSGDWNEEQDAGRSLSEGTAILKKQFPQFRKEIEMYYRDWEKMLKGPIQINVEIFYRLKESGCYRLLALTNWSDETFPVALKKFSFLYDFDGILVSGIEKIRKPQPEFYQLMLDRFKINPSETLFIDDNFRNIQAAQDMGIQAIHLPEGISLKEQLGKFSIYL